MRALLDTCVLAELRRPEGHTRVKAAVAELSDEDLYVSVLSVGEIAKGIALLGAGWKRRVLALWLISLEAKFGDRILAIDTEAGRLSDFDEGIRLDPKFSEVRYLRAAVLFSTRFSGVESGVKFLLDLDGWQARLSQYAVLLAQFSARRAGRNDDAMKIPDEAASRCDTADWPYPVVKYLRAEIDESKLMAAATDNNKLTETRCFLGLDMEQKGRNEEALAHFHWVKEHGNSGSYKYTIALGELDVMEIRSHLIPLVGSRIVDFRTVTHRCYDAIGLDGSLKP